jgi:excisionase family DNA binding protein
VNIITDPASTAERLLSLHRLLTPGEVAQLFRVDPKTVTRWAANGRISSVRTPGGHRRFHESVVRGLLREGLEEGSDQVEVVGTP